MNLDNVYSFTVQRQNSSEVAPGKSPCVKIKFIKDESIKNHSPRYKIGPDNISESTSINGEEKPDLIVDDVSAGSSPLSICPIYGRENNSSGNIKLVLFELLKMIEKKDSHMIFAYPVTEDQAPNYSSIIEHPMDLQSIHHRIDGGEYGCVVDLVDDMILMCHNALIYNTSDTVYYKIAAQMLNYVGKIFPRDNLNKLVTTRLNWTRGLSDAEIGDWESCLARLKVIQNEVIKNAPSGRPHRSLQKNIILQNSIMSNNKRKSQADTKMHVAKKSCGPTSLDTGNDLKPRSRVTMTSAAASPESEIDDNCSHNVQSEVSNDDDADDEDEDDDDTIDEVLATAQKAAMVAKQRLQQCRPRPVIYVDQIGDRVALVGDKFQENYPLDDHLQGMVRHLGSVNVEQLIGENDRILAQLGQLCHDPNEVVTLVTSKPLEPYSCAEQAVLVETFGDVVTAEFACNMHNFVLDLPPNSPATAAVKNKLNTATNYLTYGVDQIIIKKLKAAAEASKT